MYDYNCKPNFVIDSHDWCIIKFIFVSYLNFLFKLLTFDVLKCIKTILLTFNKNLFIKLIV